MPLSDSECEIACRNIGYDLRCGACAEQFYTGARGHACDFYCSTIPRPTGVTVETSLVEKCSNCHCYDCGCLV